VICDNSIMYTICYCYSTCFPSIRWSFHHGHNPHSPNILYSPGGLLPPGSPRGIRVCCTWNTQKPQRWLKKTIV